MASSKSRFSRHYKSNHWTAYRKNLIERVGFRCERCGNKQSEGAILQVHHQHYVPHRLPWEYGAEEVEVLCKGCHAEIHGLIPPQHGWDMVCVTDAGSLSEQCDRCRTDIRYIYTVQHPNWGILDVGVECCDDMTSTDAASEHQKNIQKHRRRRKTFVKSQKWKKRLNYEYRIYKEFEFKISYCQYKQKYFIEMSANKFVFVRGKQLFTSKNAAKAHIFDIVEDGRAANFWHRHTHRMSVHRAKLRGAVGMRSTVC